MGKKIFTIFVYLNLWKTNCNGSISQSIDRHINPYSTIFFFVLKMLSAQKNIQNYPACKELSILSIHEYHSTLINFRICYFGAQNYSCYGFFVIANVKDCSCSSGLLLNVSALTGSELLPSKT